MAKSKDTTPLSRQARNQSLITQTPQTAMTLPSGVKALRQVTVPSFSLKDQGNFRYLGINSAMRISKVVDKPADGTRTPKEPATICDVVDLQTGELGCFIVSTMIKSNLERDYPDDTYVGKAFYFVNTGKKKGKDNSYNTYSIFEIDPATVPPLQAPALTQE